VVVVAAFATLLLDGHLLVDGLLIALGIEDVEHLLLLGQLGVTLDGLVDVGRRPGDSLVEVLDVGSLEAWIEGVRLFEVLVHLHLDEVGDGLGRRVVDFLELLLRLQVVEHLGYPVVLEDRGQVVDVQLVALLFGVLLAERGHTQVATRVESVSLGARVELVGGVGCQIEHTVARAVFHLTLLLLGGDRVGEFVLGSIGVELAERKESLVEVVVVGFRMDVGEAGGVVGHLGVDGLLDALVFVHEDGQVELVLVEEVDASEGWSLAYVLGVNLRVLGLVLTLGDVALNHRPPLLGNILEAYLHFAANRLTHFLGGLRYFELKVGETRPSQSHQESIL
jgi:hypothetical protein